MRAQRCITTFYQQPLEDAAAQIDELWQVYLKLAMINKLTLVDVDFPSVRLREMMDHLLAIGYFSERTFNSYQFMYYEFFRTLGDHLKLLAPSVTQSYINDIDENDHVTWRFYHDDWKLTMTGERVVSDGLSLTQIYIDELGGMFNYIKIKNKKY